MLEINGVSSNNVNHLIEQTELVLNSLLNELERSDVDKDTLKHFSEFCKNYSLELMELVYKK